MSLANSNGPKWIRAQHVEAKKRWEGVAPIRDFLANILRPKSARASDNAKVDFASKREPLGAGVARDEKADEVRTGP
jgi:hypothetical protein